MGLLPLEKKLKKPDKERNGAGTPDFQKTEKILGEKWAVTLFLVLPVVWAVLW